MSNQNKPKPICRKIGRITVKSCGKKHDIDMDIFYERLQRTVLNQLIHWLNTESLFDNVNKVTNDYPLFLRFDGDGKPITERHIETLIQNIQGDELLNQHDIIIEFKYGVNILSYTNIHIKTIHTIKIIKGVVVEHIKKQQRTYPDAEYLKLSGFTTERVHDDTDCWRSGLVPLLERISLHHKDSEIVKRIGLNPQSDRFKRIIKEYQHKRFDKKPLIVKSASDLNAFIQSGVWERLEKCINRVDRKINLENAQSAIKLKETLVDTFVTSKYFTSLVKKHETLKEFIATYVNIIPHMKYISDGDIEIVTFCYNGCKIKGCLILDDMVIPFNADTSSVDVIFFFDTHDPINGAKKIMGRMSNKFAYDIFNTFNTFINELLDNTSSKHHIVFSDYTANSERDISKDEIQNFY